jgi:hypothetical protein
MTRKITTKEKEQQKIDEIIAREEAKFTHNRKLTKHGDGKKETEKERKKRLLEYLEELDNDDKPIEKGLTKAEIKIWEALKTEDDREDLNESNLHKKKKKGSAVVVKEYSLKSLDAIIQDHPSLEFPDDHKLVARILKLNKQDIPAENTDDTIYFLTL